MRCTDEDNRLHIFVEFPECDLVIVRIKDSLICQGVL